jgi:hypothetical protein
MKWERTLAILLDEFPDEELARVYELTTRFKSRFGSIGNDMLADARKTRTDVRAVELSIVAECLLLAAAMHRGDRNHFLLAASAARDAADETMPKTGTEN